MTIKEKARELFDFFYADGDHHENTAKRYAIKVIDELLKYGNLYNNHNYPKDVKIEDTVYYWIAIKQELEEL
jgi:hypothetical protein